MADDRITTKEIDAVIHRIVEAVHPLRVILFGSAARGEAGPDSDLDIMVIMPDGANRRETTQYLHTRLFGVSVAVDIVVATLSDITRHKDNVGLIYRAALEEGKELYAA